MFNAVKVNSQLRNSNYLEWYREGGEDYAMNGHWIIKANLRDERYRKILGLLVELFGNIPGEKKGLKRLRKVGGFGLSEILTKPDWFAFLDEEENAIQLTNTGLIFGTTSKNKMNIFKGNDYIYLNCHFLEMIKSDCTNVKGGEKLQPVYFTNEDALLMIMPVRVCEDNEYLKVIQNKKDPKELQLQEGK